MNKIYSPYTYMYMIEHLYILYICDKYSTTRHILEKFTHAKNNFNNAYSIKKS